MVKGPNQGPLWLLQPGDIKSSAQVMLGEGCKKHFEWFLLNRIIPQPVTLNQRGLQYFVARKIIYDNLAA